MPPQLGKQPPGIQQISPHDPGEDPSVGRNIERVHCAGNRIQHGQIFTTLPVYKAEKAHRHELSVPCGYMSDQVVEAGGK